MLDGMVARRMRLQSALGAKLDSAADMFFAAAILFVMMRSISIPTWALICAACAAALRIFSYCACACRFRCLRPLHTYANKATGALLFAFPLMYLAMGVTISSAILCAAAILSSAEELAITVRSKELNPDCKGLFFR